MSDQSKEQNQKVRGILRASHAGRPATRIGDAVPASAGPAQPLTDPAANAALALAVSSARRQANSARDVPKRPETAKTEAAPRAARMPAANENRSSLPKRLGALAAVALVASAGGWFGGRSLSVGPSLPETMLAETARHLRESEADVKALKVAVAALEESLIRSRTDSDRKQADLIERLERVPRESLAGLARLGEQVQRLEAAAAGPSLLLSGLGDQLGRIERSLSGPTRAAPSEAEAAAVEVKLASADAPVEGWVLHEVYDGIALIEGRNRRLLEVGPGEMVPGVGRVEAIERRGRRWVVVTAKGVISTVR